MAHRVCLTGLGLVMVVAGYAVPRRALGGAGPRPATPTSAAAAGLGGPDIATTPSTAAVTGNGATAVAAQFTVAYFTAGPGESPTARRQRCRPFDTDALDQQLGVRSWNGAGNDAAPDHSDTVTIDTITLADNAQGSPRPRAGYELTVTVTAAAAGQVLHADHRDAQLWLTSPSSDVWRVDQMSVT